MQALELWYIERSRLAFDWPLPSVADAGLGSDRRATLRNINIRSGTTTMVAVRIVRKSDGGALPLIQVSRSDVTHFPTDCTNRACIAKLGQEIRLRADLNHPNVQSFFGYWLNPDNTEAFLVYPDAPFGSISQHLKSKGFPELEKMKLVRYVLGLPRPISLIRRWLGLGGCQRPAISPQSPTARHSRRFEGCKPLAFISRVTSSIRSSFQRTTF